MVEYSQEHNDDVNVLAWFDRIGGTGWCWINDVNFCNLKDGQQKVGGNIFVLRVDAGFYHFENVDALLLEETIKEILRKEKRAIIF